MKSKYKELLIYLLSILSLLLFFYLSINYLTKKPIEIINFIKSDIHDEFEIEIANNLDDVNSFLEDYSFIENHLLKRIGNEVNIQIILKKTFAKNNFTKEVIFDDNSTAHFKYFKANFLGNIKLIDISKNSIQINKYLKENYQNLSLLFNIVEIEYIDNRRYNLVLNDGKVVMLPKVIDSELLYFIKNNIGLINKSTNYAEFLDLRNFHNKTIRIK